MINQMLLKNEEQFKEFVLNNYDMNEWGINIKYQHTFSVANICFGLAKKLNLDSQLAYYIGLLHDYARFSQWEKYKSFVDYLTIDHGNEAVRLLFKENKIDDFYIDKKYYPVIYFAVKMHNKPVINEEIIKDNIDIFDNIYTLEEIVTYCKLVRDADKIDIFNLMRCGKIDVKQTADGQTFQIVEAMKNNTFTDTKLIKTKLDRILSLIGFINDINYIESLKYIDFNLFFEGVYNHYGVLLNEQDNKCLHNIIDNYVIPHINDLLINN